MAVVDKSVELGADVEIGPGCVIGPSVKLGDRTKLIEALSQKYEEVPSAFGIVGQKNLVELFVSKSGSWTMLMTQSSGATCIMAAGQSWEQFPATTKMTGL